ncbi:glucuronyl hydrolase [Echinicola pacifica]|uniref:Glucuronyl hydrolase n=1 Tax=Echinicola pacifica TaxID=346377 RepID=A0A918PUK4_9BACT|nr:glycoside hydrolase family 88 protein [Echinicola pacifica]GGZ21725.1 glucuronyl hydrolase [Echinicola pacifica]
MINFKNGQQAGWFANLLLLSVIVLHGSCSSTAKSNAENTSEVQVTSQPLESLSIQTQTQKAETLYAGLAKVAREAKKAPRSIEEDGEIMWVRNGFDWTEGFFAGSLWYLYELTGDKEWMEEAQYFQELNKEDRFFSNHDLGFVFNNSYGNGLRISGDKAYAQVLIDAANTLMDRYNPEVGCILSWNVDGGWQSKRGWEFPVIIDNMMNLELLFVVSEMTGDAKYAEVAINHANTTMKHHFREDYSSYHVVDYDPISGEVRNKERAQGFSHESSWSRGQAWGLYGYIMCYRFTEKEEYLEQARNIAAFILSNPEIRKNDVPFWDYDAQNIPQEPKDASAAAITTSALLELSTYSEGDYLQRAKDMLKTLSGPEYFAKPGENHNFLLKHSVGSIPHNSEIDKPLNYADYYYLESLLRLRNWFEMDS